MTDDNGLGETASRPPTPWWVKVIGIGLLILIILAAIALVVGGEHGPGMHGAGLQSRLAWLVHTSPV
jgi:hypothetical protein